MEKTGICGILLLLLLGCSNDDHTHDPDHHPPLTVNDDPAGTGPLVFTPCENGMAGPFPCNGFYMQSRISLQQMSASAANDIWGWTDTESGKEYALIGLDNGTGFADISDPAAPVFLGSLPTATTASTWRDLKVYRDHVFIVSEAGGHGMQVMDLKKLAVVTNPPVQFTADAHLTDFSSAHNITINEESGFAYIVGTPRENIGGNTIFVDISNPGSPIISGRGMAYTHDAQVVNYMGPDPDYQGREIFFGSNEDRVAIADVTDKDAVVDISQFSYADVRYTHQGWITDDHRYFIVGDELDEIQTGINTRTLVFDISDLDSPVLHAQYSGPSAAIDHNGYVQGDKYYLANYTAGLRQIDLSGIENGQLSETGFFDTFPSDDDPGFQGVWSVYPYFQSGNIILSDVGSGLFVISPIP